MTVGGHFLPDQFHREDRFQVVRADRLVRGGMERRIERGGQICLDIIPFLWHLLLIEEDLCLHIQYSLCINIYIVEQNCVFLHCNIHFMDRKPQPFRLRPYNVLCPRPGLFSAHSPLKTSITGRRDTNSVMNPEPVPPAPTLTGTRVWKYRQARHDASKVPKTKPTTGMKGRTRSGTMPTPGANTMPASA